LQSVLGEGNNIQMNFTTDFANSVINNDEKNRLHYVPNIGSFIGDGCKIGSNVIIDSGKIIGSNCDIRSMKRISENLNNYSIAV
jgi:UDP-3-O-[3-hydroxymyristoyl] glucosamine N-acyltransferase